MQNFVVFSDTSFVHSQYVHHLLSRGKFFQFRFDFILNDTVFVRRDGAIHQINVQSIQSVINSRRTHVGAATEFRLPPADLTCYERREVSPPGGPTNFVPDIRYLSPLRHPIIDRQMKRGTKRSAVASSLVSIEEKYIAGANRCRKCGKSSRNKEIGLGGKQKHVRDVKVS
jgi:hypothetical protein